MRGSRAATCLLFLLISASCQKFVEGKQMFRELLALRDQLAREFHEKVVDVNVTTDGHMTVKFINSPLRGRSRAEKQQRADAVAAFASKHYAHHLSSVTTQFVPADGSDATRESYTGQMP